MSQNEKSASLPPRCSFRAMWIVLWPDAFPQLVSVPSRCSLPFPTCHLQRPNYDVPTCLLSRTCPIHRALFFEYCTWTTILPCIFPARRHQEICIADGRPFPPGGNPRTKRKTSCYSVATAPGDQGQRRPPGGGDRSGSGTRVPSLPFNFAPPFSHRTKSHALHHHIKTTRDGVCHCHTSGWLPPRCPRFCWGW